jgi:hypothetical protein
MDMTEFEHVLQECLRELEQGASSVEECLRRYPNHAAQLEPVLLTSAYLARAREARLSPAFKARVRNRLIREMYAHPRKRTRPAFLFMRLAASLAVVILTLLGAGTVYAQRALPGEAFYGWKLTSENAWRAVTPDPVGADLAIAQRRVNELITVQDNPALSYEVLQAYLEVADRLKSEVSADEKAFILAVLDVQFEELNQAGILPIEPEQTVVPSVDLPTATATPATSPVPVVETLRAEPTKVLPNSTDIPRAVPTVDVEVSPELVPTLPEPPDVISTLPEPPEIIPTIEFPPLP